MKRISLVFVASMLATQALAQTQFPPSTLWGNFTASSGLPTVVQVPNCPTGALNFTAGTGLGCGIGGGGSIPGLVHTHLFVGNSANLATDFGSLATFADSGGLTLNPTSGTNSAGLSITQTTPNTGSQGSSGINLNSIVVNDGNNLVDVFSVGLLVQQNLLSNVLGQKAALYVASVRNTAATSTSNDQIGIVSFALAGVSSGGTDTGSGAKGALYGMNPIVTALVGATNYDIFAGVEANVSVASGATVRRRIGISAAGSDVGTGDLIDAAFEVGSGNAGWKTGLIFTQTRGSPALASGGTVIGSDGIAQTVASIISLPNWTISGKIFDFTTAGFTVDGATGLVTTKSINVTTAASGYQISGVTVMKTDAHYLYFADPGGNFRFFFGDSSDPQNYFRNDAGTLVQNSSGSATFGRISSSGIFLGNGVNNTGTKLTMATGVPTLTGGFCTSPSVVTANGTAAFALNVGSACATGAGTITLPAATTGWSCNFSDITAPGTNVVAQTGGTTTTATIQNYLRTTGATANFGSGDVIRGSCVGF